MPANIVQANHARLGVHQRLQRLTRMFAALGATNEAILRTRSPEQLYQQVCDAALSGGNFLVTAILLLEPGSNTLKFAAGAGHGIEQLQSVKITVQETSPEGQGLAGVAYRTGKPCVSNDFLNDARTKAWRDQARKAGVRAAVALPMMRAGASIGVLLVYLDEAGALDDEMISLLTRISDNLSFALDTIDRETANRNSERAARRLARMFAALSATNEAILRARTPEELYQLACDGVVRGGKALAGAVLVPEPGSTWLRPVVGTGEVAELLKLTRFSIDPDNPYGKGVCGTAFRTQEPSVNPDILTSEQARPWRNVSVQTGVVACAALPLIRGGDSVGVFLFFISQSWAADEEIMALLARIAENVSFALDNFEHEKELRAAETRTQYLATHDDLTGLPNRAMFSRALNDSIKVACEHGQRFSVMFIDLDRFKIINDTLGHAAGDILLREVTARLEQCLSESDVIARLAGDEFVVLVRDVSDAQHVAVVARKILSAVGKPMIIHGHECRVTASIGISTYPTDAEDEETLTKTADAAMYLAKEEGRSSFRFYSKEIKTQSIERLMLETSLRHALERNEFLLHYQAKQDLGTGDISGVEALLRWTLPDLGALSPMQFIPLAEETGLIVPIGRWALKTACAQNMAWRRQGLPPLSMAVNLSPRQFSDENLLQDIDDALAASGMPPQLLQLEITESMVMHNVARAIELLDVIRSRGVRLAIDDFGTGYSSMSLMKKFPVDTIKIDRSFVQDLPHDAEDRAIAQAIVSMGKALGLTVVAEGVETCEQAAFLREHGCDEMQGHLFSKAVAAERIPEILRSTRVFPPPLQSLELIARSPARGREADRLAPASTRALPG